MFEDKGETTSPYSGGDAVANATWFSSVQDPQVSDQPARCHVLGIVNSMKILPSETPEPNLTQPSSPSALTHSVRSGAANPTISLMKKSDFWGGEGEGT